MTCNAVVFGSGTAMTPGTGGKLSSGRGAFVGVGDDRNPSLAAAFERRRLVLDRERVEPSVFGASFDGVSGPGVLQVSKVGRDRPAHPCLELRSDSSSFAVLSSVSKTSNLLLEKKEEDGVLLADILDVGEGGSR